MKNRAKVIGPSVGSLKSAVRDVDSPALVDEVQISLTNDASIVKIVLQAFYKSLFVLRTTRYLRRLKLYPRLELQFDKTETLSLHPLLALKAVLLQTLFVNFTNV